MYLKYLLTMCKLYIIYLSIYNFNFIYILYIYVIYKVYININIYIYALVIARFRVQYGQYFPSFSYFADLFHEPLGE